MAMVDLAAHTKGRPVSLADIAQRQEISLSYLEQLFGKLRRGDLVRSVRGPGGGYLLSRSPEDTRIADIVLSVDEPLRATRCRTGSPQGCQANSGRCLTHDLWEELGRQIQTFLNSVSLADVIDRRVGVGRPADQALETTARAVAGAVDGTPQSPQKDKGSEELSATKAIMPA